MEQAEKINVNLHGHVLAGFDNWWRKQYNILGKNLAGVLTDICIQKRLGIYAITDDVFGKINGIGRFAQIFEEAKILSSENYKVQKLGEDAFVVSKCGEEVYFIDGQSLEIEEKGRKYELLTFGRSGIGKFSSFNEAHKYLSGEGLLAIAEHPIAEGHYGSMGQRLEELCAEKKIDAVEHNAKIAVPNWFLFFPVFSGFTKNKNESAIKIAEHYGIPIVANDDSDTIPMIGSAYSIFTKAKIKFGNSESLVKSLGEIIRENDFDTYRGYVNFADWIRFTVLDLTIKGKILGLKERYLKNNVKTSFSQQ